MSVTTPLIGLGDVQRAALIQLFEGLNQVVEEVNQMYQADDEATALRLRREYVPVTIEPVENHNFLEGHHPSLVKAGIDRFPNCAAWAVRATPAAGSMSSDHSSVYNDLLYVELMVKAIESEHIVNLRAHRMAEAANICLMRDTTLGRRVSGFLTDPTVLITDVQGRREQTIYGDNWYWQAIRLEYAVRKDAQNPTSRPGELFAQGMPYEIDQA